MNRGTLFAELKPSVLSLLEREGIKLENGLPNGFKDMVQNETDGYSINDISYVIQKIRKQTGKFASEHLRGCITDTVPSSLSECCLQDGLIRGSNNEGPAIDLMVACCGNEKILPHGGKAMMIGTPVSFCACPSVNNNLLITDNLRLAHIVDFTTEYPVKIIVGSAVDENKAITKVQQWRSNSSTKDFDTRYAWLDRFTYYDFINEFASDGKLTKVFKLDNGTWKDCKYSKRKRKLMGHPEMDLNFHKSSIDLSLKYPNLHILAMTKEHLHSISVVHVFKGKSYTVRWKEKGER